MEDKFEVIKVNDKGKEKFKITNQIISTKTQLKKAIKNFANNVPKLEQEIEFIESGEYIEDFEKASKVKKAEKTKSLKLLKKAYTEDLELKDEVVKRIMDAYFNAKATEIRGVEHVLESWEDIQKDAKKKYIDENEKKLASYKEQLKDDEKYKKVYEKAIK